MNNGKRKFLILGTVSSVAAVLGVVGILKGEHPIFLFANKEVLYRHYAAIAPTDEHHGSVEFWANCSTLTFTLEEPIGGRIEEGPSFDSTPYFDELEMDDARYVPSLSRKIENGVTPVIKGNAATYGLYPQDHISDAALLQELNKLETPESNGWYLYEGSYYAKVAAKPNEYVTAFSDGASVSKGEIHWFACRRISWRILQEKDGDYTLLADSLLDAYWYGPSFTGTNAQMHYANNYGDSGLRSWLNDVFYNKAFALDATYVKTSYVNNAPNTTNTWANSYSCLSTNDKVYSLSYSELRDANWGFYDTQGIHVSRRCRPTDYAYASGASFYPSYWTRSPSHVADNRAWTVLSSGALDTEYVKEKSVCVRPAITLNLGE